LTQSSKRKIESLALVSEQKNLEEYPKWEKINKDTIEEKCTP